MTSVDVVVVGAGPNGLVAATLLGRAGLEVLVVEREDVWGGAVRSKPMTLPGFVHDPFSAFYGLLHMSPVLEELGLDHRVQWAHADFAIGAAVGPDRSLVVHRDTERTIELLQAHSSADADGYRQFVALWETCGDQLAQFLLGPMPPLRNGFGLLRATGLRGAQRLAAMLLAPYEEVVRRTMHTEEGAALLACGATHSDVAIDAAGSTPAALLLAQTAQRHGMPVPVGGAQRLADALAMAAQEAGVVIRCATDVVRVQVADGRAVGVVTPAGSITARRAVVADTDVGQLGLDLVGADHLPVAYVEGLRRRRHGSGLFRLELALGSPAPWLVEDLRRTAVVHLTGSLDTIADSQHQVRRHLLPRRPLLIVGQPCVADPSRAPAGSATLWVECGVPGHPWGDAASASGESGWAAHRERFSERCLDVLEEHAPGLRASVMGNAVLTPADLAAADRNLVGGDVNGGSAALDQQVLLRPVPGFGGYRLPLDGLYLCSASAHPGGGVHGMGGRNCARAVLADLRPGVGGVRRVGRRLARTLERRRPPVPMP